MKERTQQIDGKFRQEIFFIRKFIEYKAKQGVFYYTGCVNYLPMVKTAFSCFPEKYNDCKACFHEWRYSRVFGAK